MADLERNYIVPLRREWLKVPKYKRTAKAIRALRQFVQKHMKLENVAIGRYLNMKLWERGTKSPPHKVSVHVKILEKEDKKKNMVKYAHVELAGAPADEIKEEKTTLADKLKGKPKQKEVKEAELVEQKQEPLAEKKALLETEKEEVLKKELIKKIRKPARKDAIEKKHMHRKQEKVIGKTGKSKGH